MQPMRIVRDSSTTDAVRLLAEKQKAMHAPFFGFQKTFDRVLHKVILRTSETQNVSQEGVLQNDLTGRRKARSALHRCNTRVFEQKKKRHKFSGDEIDSLKDQNKRRRAKSK